MDSGKSPRWPHDDNYFQVSKLLEFSQNLEPHQLGYEAKNTNRRLFFQSWRDGDDAGMFHVHLKWEKKTWEKE